MSSRHIALFRLAGVVALLRSALLLVTKHRASTGTVARTVRAAQPTPTPHKTTETSACAEVS